MWTQWSWQNSLDKNMECYMKHSFLSITPPKSWILCYLNLDNLIIIFTISRFPTWNLISAFASCCFLHEVSFKTYTCSTGYYHMPRYDDFLKYSGNLQLWHYSKISINVDYHICPDLMCISFDRLNGNKRLNAIMSI